MPAAPAPLPDLSTLDADALRVLILQQHATLLSRDNEIENLKLLILKLRRMQFGRKSERLDTQITQLELRLEDLEAAQTEIAAAPDAAVGCAPLPRRKPVRRPLLEHRLREVKTHAPAQTACPACGGALSKLGEDVSEILEYVPAQFKVIRQVRPSGRCGLSPWAD